MANAARMLLRLKDVADMVGLSVRTIHRYEHDGMFPPRRRIGPGANGAMGWTPEDIRAWRESRPTGFAGSPKRQPRVAAVADDA